jgi:hypothetical protein
MEEDVVLVDIIGNAVASMSICCNYQPGRNIQILKSLNDLDNSISMKGVKYPLIAMFLPVREDMNTLFYGIARIPRIVIATITQSTDDVFKRYQECGTFKSILYPCYYEFFRQLARSPNIIGSDPSGFNHTKMDNPGTQSIGEGSTDYIDSIEILNLELTLNQIINCKKNVSNN